MINKIEDRLVAEWRSAWKLWSVQLNALGLVLTGVAEAFNQGIVALPPSIMDRVPHASTIAAICFGLSVAARLFRQDKKSS